jgi:rhodanese-related sulfurtransferase
MKVLRRKYSASAVIALMFLAAGTFVLFLERDPGVKKLTAAQTVDLVTRDSSAILIDVRTPEEWKGESGHLRNALLIPLADLSERLPELEQYRSRPIVVYCRSGNRSGKAAKILIDHGFDAFNMTGGMRQWNARGYPVIREQ